MPSRHTFDVFDLAEMEAKRLVRFRRRGGPEPEPIEHQHRSLEVEN